MPVVRKKESDFAKVKELVSELISQGELVYVWASGAPGPDGKSWCPDCVKAEPVVEKFFETSDFKNTAHVIEVLLPREVHKNMQNPFRKDDKIDIQSVPTILFVNGRKRLEENECADKDYLEMVFEDALGQ